MTQNDKQMHINLVANLNTAHDGLAGYQRDHGVENSAASVLDTYRDYARVAEEGNFTSFFLGDTAAAMGAPVSDGGAPEPITALTAVAGVTENLGVLATMSTTFYDPYNVARLVGSLDQVSDGRAGWNAVTSASAVAAPNFSYAEFPGREARYAMAEEFVDVVASLWRNREIRTDAQGDKRFFAESIDFVGTHFQVKGPLNVAPSRQGSPLIAQAGGSGPGIRLGARYADLLFTNANSIDDALAYKAELRKALVAVGRDRRDLPVMPGVAPYLAKTARDAEEFKQELDSHLNYEQLVPRALAGFGIDFEWDDVNDPFPVEVLPDPDKDSVAVKNSLGNYRGLHTWVMSTPGVTIKQVAAQTAGGWTHRKFVGSYDDFVDDAERWFRSGAADGFSLIAPIGVPSLRDFVDEVVPRLERRGIYRNSPDDRPLRARFDH